MGTEKAPLSRLDGARGREGAWGVRVRRSQRIDHSQLPIVSSPSGLPTQHLISACDGAEHIFVAQQWLQPGDRVLLHTHPVEEAITFLSGSGEAMLGDEIVPIGAGISLYIPAGVVHGFQCTEGTLHVLVVFPGAEFAETTIVERTENTTR